MRIPMRQYLASNHFKTTEDHESTMINVSDIHNQFKTYIHHLLQARLFQVHQPDPLHHEEVNRHQLKLLTTAQLTLISKSLNVRETHMCSLSDVQRTQRLDAIVLQQSLCHNKWDQTILSMDLARSSKLTQGCGTHLTVCLDAAPDFYHIWIGQQPT